MILRTVPVNPYAYACLFLEISLWPYTLAAIEESAFSQMGGNGLLGLAEAPPFALDADVASM